MYIIYIVHEFLPQTTKCITVHNMPIVLKPRILYMYGMYRTRYNNFLLSIERDAKYW